MDTDRSHALTSQISDQNVSAFFTTRRARVFAVALFGAMLASWFVFAARDEAITSDLPIVCRDAIWDVGSLSQEKPVRLVHSFKLENLSGASVGIVKIVPDCGCVVAENKLSELSPSASTELTLSVNPAGQPPGPFRKVAHVVLDTTPPSKLTLVIRGIIAPSPAFYLVPTKVDFGILTQKETRSRSVKIVRYDGTPVRFLRAFPLSKALQVKAATSGGDADSFMELTLSLDNSGLKAGDFKSSVLVVTEHAGYSDVTIPVVAIIAEQPHGLVASIFLDRLLKGVPQERDLSARRRSFA